MAERISPCPECGGPRVIVGVSGEQARYFYPPDSTGPTLPINVHAKICTQCGHVTHYISEPLTLKRKIAYEDDLSVRKAALADRKADFEAKRAARQAESRGGKPLYPTDKS